ncbi:MAG: biotin/lipoate A/B protein ligase family protein [Fervidicoccaceae archaeon]
MLDLIVAEWPRDPFFNLAFEEAVYRVGPRGGASGVLRLWRNERAVVVGRLQCAPLEVDALQCAALGVKVVRRFTGGGAVYHDLGNLNYALTIDRRRHGVEDARSAFELVGRAVAEALSGLGVEGASYRPLNDVEAGGLKISGMAASISAGRVFVHGAMLVSSDIEVLWRVLKISPEKLSDKSFVPSRPRRVTTVERELGRRVDPLEVGRAVAESLAEALGAELSEPRGPDELELGAARELYERRYSRLEWNLWCLEKVRGLLSPEEVEALRLVASPEAVGRGERDLR